MKYRENPRIHQPQEGDARQPDAPPSKSSCDLDDIIFRDECWRTSDR